MACVGKIVGFSVGGLIGNIPGAIIGLFVGHFLIDRKQNSESASGSAPWFSNTQTQTQFPKKPNFQNDYRHRFISSWSGMVAKMAKADGKVTRIEITTIEQFFDQVLRLDSATRKVAIAEFKKAKDSPLPFSHYANEFKRVTGNDPRVNRQILDILIRLAGADGYIHPQEDVILHEASRIFGVTSTEYSNMKTAHSSSIDKYFNVLGLPQTASNEEIKKKYRELAKEYHPDVIAGQGMPKDFVEYSTRRFQEIQEAYSSIKKDRGFR